MIRDYFLPLTNYRSECSIVLNGTIFLYCVNTCNTCWTLLNVYLTGLMWGPEYFETPPPSVWWERGCDRWHRRKTVNDDRQGDGVNKSMDFKNYLFISYLFIYLFESEWRKSRESPIFFLSIYLFIFLFIHLWYLSYHFFNFLLHLVNINKLSSK